MKIDVDDKALLEAWLSRGRCVNSFRLTGNGDGVNFTYPEIRVSNQAGDVLYFEYLEQGRVIRNISIPALEIFNVWTLLSAAAVRNERGSS